MPGEDGGSNKDANEGLTRKRKVKKVKEDLKDIDEKESVDNVIDTVQEIVEEVSTTAVKEVAARVVGAKGAEIAGDISKEIVHEVGESIQDVITGENKEETENSDAEDVIDIENENDEDSTEEIIEIEDEDSVEEIAENEEIKDLDKLVKENESEEVPEEDEISDEEKAPSLADALALIGNSEDEEVDEDEISEKDSSEENNNSAEENKSEDEEEETEDFTMRKMVSALLAKETLPHLLLLVIASSALFILAKLDSENSGLIAISFISLCVGYSTVALTSGNEKIYSLLQAKLEVKESDDEKVGIPIQTKLMRIVKSWLKAWILPVVYSSIILGVLLALFGKDSRLEEIGNMLPMILGGFFIAWSATQAISFKNSVVASIKRRTDTEEEIETVPKTLLVNITQMIIILGFSAGLVIIFYHYLQGAEGEVLDAFKGEGGIFLGIVFAMILVLQNSTRSMRIIAGHRKSTSRFTFWWSLILGLFMSWHLLSIYRRVVGADDNILMIIEEITLMIFTVLMTIWSLSSRGISKGSKLFTERNALFWGLSFGFGYAGSITMVTVIVGKNVDFVMGIGHGVTLLTLLILHRSAIKKSLKDAELMNTEGEYTITPKKGW